jgi:dolichyl-diphosphooligosaccharide--protein glycosyltransferase
MNERASPWTTRVFAPCGLFALAVAVRALPWPSVLGDERVGFVGADAYYHMRRILYGLVRFPETLSFDPYINFPHGAKAIWPPLFDTAVAWLVLPFHAAGGEVWAERAAVWVPPLLGGATVVALYFLALRFFGFATALLAGVTLSILFGHFWYSQLGFLDHHAAVALVSTGLLAAAMRLLSRLTSKADGGGTTRPVVATALAVATALLLWPGSLLHVGLVEGALLVHLMTRRTSEQAIRSAGALAALHLIALAIVLPFTASAHWPQWGDFSPAVLSRFQPWLLGALALHGGACWGCWRGGAGTTRAGRGAQVLLLAGLVGVASALLFPGLVEGARDAWEWLAKQESFQASVAESQPLFVVRGQFTVRVAESRLTRFVYLLPLALVALAWRTRARADREAVWLFIGWTLGLAIVTLVQKRFFNSFSVSLALVFAWSVTALHTTLAPRARGAGTRLALAAVMTAVAWVLLAPMIEAYRTPVVSLARFVRGEPPATPSTRLDTQLIVESAVWIRENTPTTSGFLDASLRPEWGILSPSGIGHVLGYVARRPVVTNNFGDDIGRENYEAARRYLASRDEKEAEQIADDLGARYVVVSAPTVPGGRIPAHPAMQRRLAEYDGRGLGGLRLVFEGSPPRLSKGRSTPYKVFERVAGARVRGRGDPGATVSAELELRTHRARPLLYRVHTVVDTVGSYELRLPYANRDGSPSIETGESYQLESGGCEDSVAVEEHQVTGGEEVRGPDLSCRDEGVGGPKPVAPVSPPSRLREG